MYIGAQREEALDRARNKCNEHSDNARIIDLKRHRERLGPRPMWMASSNNPLREDKVDDKEKNNSSSNEYLSCDSNAEVRSMCTPNQAHSTGYYSRHTETKEHARHEELMTLPLVELQDRHMHYRAEEEEDEADGGDGII